jgi:FkbM family methyltransferase
MAVGERLRWWAMLAASPYLQNRRVDRGKWFLLQRLNPSPGNHDAWARFGRRIATLPTGGRIECDLVHNADRTLYLTGEYEPFSTRLIRRILDRGWRFVDIGGNVGKYTIFVAPIVDHVLCFEPNPVTLERLKANLALNDFDNVRLFELGLSDAAGEAQIFLAGDDLGGASVLKHSEDMEPHDIRLEVGDAVIEPHETLRTYVKIDVEGLELRVLRGLPRLLASRDVVVQLELTDTLLRRDGGSAAELIELMRGHGYHTYRFDHLTRVRSETVLTRLDRPSSDFQYDVLFTRHASADEFLSWADAHVKRGVLPGLAGLPA